MNKKEFVNYCFDFYGKNKGIYKDFFNNTCTKKEIIKAVNIRINAPTKIPFEGDSIDRELVRDIMFKIRDPKSITENKINLPKEDA